MTSFLNLFQQWRIRGFLSFTVKLRLRMCRKSDQWIFGCFMGLRTGIRGSLDGGTDSAMEALEWPKTITTEQSTFLVHNKIIQDFSNTNRCREIKQAIRYYEDLSETQLITIRDLLRVMLTLKSPAPAQRKSIMATAVSSSTSSRLSTRRALQNKHLHLVREKSVKFHYCNR